MSELTDDEYATALAEEQYWECARCNWTGEDDFLVDNTDDGVFNQCPRCGGICQPMDD